MLPRVYQAVAYQRNKIARTVLWLVYLVDVRCHSQSQQLCSSSLVFSPLIKIKITRSDTDIAVLHFFFIISFFFF